ncbi:MAG: DUF222 domain-containing protein [Actinomycetes bacterium]
MDAPEEAEPDEVTATLGRLTRALDNLLALVESGKLEVCDDNALLGFLTEFERFRNRLPLVDHAVIAEADRRGLPDTLCQGTMRRVLTAALRLSPAEAGRRVRTAAALGARTSMLGEPLAPRGPVLAAAQRNGAVTPEQVDIIVSGLDSVDRRGFDPAAIAAGEELLTGFAHTFGTRDLRRLTEKTVDGIDPDGTRPKDELNADRRFLRLRQGSDGSYRGEFRLTGPAGAKLSALLSPLARPRTDTEVAADGSRSAFRVDERSHGQRMHDALESVCDRLLRAGSLPESGGTPTTVIVTIDMEDLLERTGYGTTSDGTLIPTDQVLRMAGQAEVVPALLTKGGAVLDLGRTRRVATPTQTYALIARDGGCSFPGCASPPEWCDRHHLVAWADGGSTAVDNLTLLCGYHHHNFVARGWSCRLNPDGLPEWIPPAWLDRDRRPLINTRVTTRLVAARQRASAPPLPVPDPAPAPG